MHKKHDYHIEETREMVSIFKDVHLKYRYIRNNLKFSSQGKDETLAKFRDDVRKIHVALDNIKPLQSYLITQSFRGDNKVYNEWWKGIYKKSTLYRLRHCAIQAFLKEYHSL